MGELCGFYDCPGFAAGHLIGAAASANELNLASGPAMGRRSFRLDALSTFFGVVINLGGQGELLRRSAMDAIEAAPTRVLPFFPAFLAG